MASSLLKPRWLAGHLIVLVLAFAFIALGFWQLGRHFDQREENAVVEAQLEQGPVPLLLDASDPAALELRPVVVTGRYDYLRQLELRPRAANGRVGYNQVVPLVVEEGVVLVNRGFIADADGIASQASQVAGDVTVTGTVRLSQGTSRFGPQNLETGELSTIARVDLDRLNLQFGGSLLPLYLDLLDEQPTAGGIPTVLPQPPAPTSRPHLPYALQWWLFAMVVTVGWAAYIRTQHRPA